MDHSRILLLGVPRSGTTWLARALGYTGGTRVVREPDNIDAEPSGDGRSALGFGPYPVLDAGDDAPQFRALWDLSFSGRIPNRPQWRRRAGSVVRRLPTQLRTPLTGGLASAMSSLPGRPQRVVVKSTYAIFTMPWLERHYRPRVIVLQRNPMNVISSWADLSIHGFDLLTRPVFRERYLDRYGVAAPTTATTQLQLIAAWVGFLAAALNEQAAQHPDWAVVTHDELCIEPRTSVRGVCETLGLPWNDEVDAYLRGADRPGEGKNNQFREAKALPDRWRRRFDDSQIAEIRAVLEQFPTQGWVRPPQRAPA